MVSKIAVIKMKSGERTIVRSRISFHILKSLDLVSVTAVRKDLQVP